VRRIIHTFKQLGMVGDHPDFVVAAFPKAQHGEQVVWWAAPK
jgi:hypothetical protein